MSTDEYVPSEFMVRGAYNYSGGSGTESDATLDAEFDRFLARVKRDAAREALDGLANESVGAHNAPPYLTPQIPRPEAEARITGHLVPRHPLPDPRGNPVTTIDRDELLAWCQNRPIDDALATMYNHELRYIVDALEQAEAERDAYRAKMDELDRAYISEHEQRKRIENRVRDVRDVIDAWNSRGLTTPPELARALDD